MKPRRARSGEKTYGQKYLGPSDDQTPGVGDLFSAFDNARLKGRAAPLPAQYAMIPTDQVLSLPHFGAEGCRVLQITPTDIVNGTVDRSGSSGLQSPSQHEPRYYRPREAGQRTKALRTQPLFAAAGSSLRSPHFTARLAVGIWKEQSTDEQNFRTSYS